MTSDTLHIFPFFILFGYGANIERFRVSRIQDFKRYHSGLIWERGNQNLYIYPNLVLYIILIFIFCVSRR